MKQWLFKPVTVDGFLWVSIALFTTMQSMLSNDDAYKYVNPIVLFWAKFWVACLGAAAAALKAFRSTTFARHLEENPTPKDIPPPQPKINT
jgi:hypothetical protein